MVINKHYKDLRIISPILEISQKTKLMYIYYTRKGSCSPQIHHLGQTEINGDKFYFAVMNKIGPSLKLCFKLL